MTEPLSETEELTRALQRIAAYAAGMVRHCEQHSFGEARSWRVVVHHARDALDLDEEGPDGAVRTPHRTPTDDELERLIRRCRLHRKGDADVALPPLEAHELLQRLADELLLWRRSHPDDLPG